MNQWEFYMDRGGTFTDVIGRDPAGNLQTLKILSSDDAPLLAIRTILGLKGTDPIPPVTLKLGSTLGTNALLEGKGRPLCLAITKGFRDLLSIGYQNRPHLFSLAIHRNLPLYDKVIEMDERVDVHGKVLIPPSPAKIRRALQAVLASGLSSLAIVFLHSYRYPDHEKMVKEMALELGFHHVFCSHEISPQVKIVPRGDTTVLDGVLTPILKEYLEKLKKSLPGSDFKIMQSHGGLVQAENFRGKDSLLSGPAGGVVGYAMTARQAGYRKVLGLDMGGTSTDVSRFDGSYEMIYETEKAGVRVQSPILNIETVAAGGGSIIHFDGIRLQVGPQSAGADPGPVCYGRGGKQLAITDANLLLGRLVPKYFDKFPLHLEPVKKTFEKLSQEIFKSTEQKLSIHQVAQGAIEIANNNMAQALRVISVARGYDPREYTLYAFGGASGQHACSLARSLGMSKILVHPFSSLLSALGIGMADSKLTREQTIHLPWTKESFEKMEELYQSMAKEVREKLEEDQSLKSTEVEYLLDMRYKGQSSQITLPYQKEKTAEAFEKMYRQRFGHKNNLPLEVVTLRIQGIGKTMNPPAFQADSRSTTLEPQDYNEIFWQGNFLKVPVYLREKIPVEKTFLGPALVLDKDLSIFVEPDFEGKVEASGFILLSQKENISSSVVEKTARDPILLEVFNRLFSSLCEQMGEALKNTAFSTNIKERLDFSCALFDARGELVANGAHIPVHLGAMSDAVKGLIESGKAIEEEDIYVTNNPFCGGSHLPDITVITPVFDPLTRERIFFVANRGHHADIGGKVPGSMPAFSTTIEEEGILIDNFRLVEKGNPHLEEFQALLLQKPYPARNIPERMSDLEAQIAANGKGVQLLQETMEHYGKETVLAYMQYMQDSAREKMESLLETYPKGKYSFEDFLDDGSKIALQITIEGNRALLDFEGTGPQLLGNLNANPAITKSAVLYVFRTLLKQEIPLNSGCLKPLEIRIPKGSFLNPEGRVAVVGGNVETSQRICDVLFGALKACGASQGTMNNFSFGDSSFGYYETLAGGSGAGEGFDGTSGVHTHMTNTRMTDPEVFELRYPAMIEEISFRKESGGKGKWKGGEGICRKVRFYKEVEVSLLTERRILAPYGMAGGKEGAVGENYKIKTILRDGKFFAFTEKLSGKAKFTAKPMDAVMVKTPGGGGYGLYEERATFHPAQTGHLFRIEGEKPTREEMFSMKKILSEIRQAIREGRYTEPTSGLAPGFVQANLVILPQKYAEDFRDFCRKNPRPCPLLEETEPGSHEPIVFAPGADLRRDLPQYSIHRKGQKPWHVSQIETFWKEDFVAFLLGCSFTFESALLQAGIPVRHIEENKNVSMYITNLPSIPSGPFSGPMVVSMRPLPANLVEKAVAVTGAYPLGHGEPIHWGAPEKIGIRDIHSPDFGDRVSIKPGEIPVFWACGVTPQVVLQNSGIPFYITHRPGHMFLTDVWGG